MKTISYKYPSKAELKSMYDTIMSYIRGEVKRVGCSILMSERGRQYFTWGANKFKYIAATNGCYGIEFKVSGLLHKGRVRIYYNRASDYFDVELLKERKDEVVWSCDDVDCFQLHNILHQHIERTDDEEV